MNTSSLFITSLLSLLLSYAYAQDSCLDNYQLSGTLQQTHFYKPEIIRADTLLANAVIQDDGNFRLEGSHVLLTDGFTVEEGGKLSINDCTEYITDKLVTMVPEVSSEVFPNPTIGPLQIGFELEVPSDVQIQLLDSYGRVVRLLQQPDSFPTGPHRLQFDLTELPDGVYFLRLQENNKQTTHRVLKQ